MAEFQRFNIKSIGGLSGSLVKHLKGEIRPWNAASRVGEGFADMRFYHGVDGRPCSSTSADEEHAEWRNILLEARERRRRSGAMGRPPTGVVQAFVAGPTFDDPPEMRDAFVRETILWIRKKCGPNTGVAVACVHNDEQSWHLHLAIVCINRQNELGWMKVRHDLAEVRPEDLPKKGREKVFLSLLQSAFHRNVASKFGLDRGHDYVATGVSNPRKYEKNVDRAKSLLNRGHEKGLVEGVETTRKQAQGWVDKAYEQGHAAGRKVGRKEGREEAAGAAAAAAEQKAAAAVARVDKRAEEVGRREKEVVAVAGQQRKKSAGLSSREAQVGAREKAVGAREAAVVKRETEAKTARAAAAAAVQTSGQVGKQIDDARAAGYRAGYKDGSLADELAVLGLQGRLAVAKQKIERLEADRVPAAAEEPPPAVSPPRIAGDVPVMFDRMPGAEPAPPAVSPETVPAAPVGPAEELRPAPEPAPDRPPGPGAAPLRAPGREPRR